MITFSRCVLQLKWGFLLASILISSSCTSNRIIYLDDKQDRINFEAVVATFPEYRNKPLPQSITPLTQLNLTEETARRQQLVLSAPKPEAIPDLPYVVGVSDVLSIVVWEHPELSITATSESPESSGSLVSTDGTIFYPYVGNVMVLGLTVDQIRTKLTKLLSETIERPQLDVRVAQYRSQKVHVVGEVNNPGLLPITDAPPTIVDAIEQAGGLTNNANLSSVSLTRDDLAYAFNLNELFSRGDPQQNIRLQNRDVLTIPSNADSKFFVLGHVRNPSQLETSSQPKVLADAIKEAGGLLPPINSPARIPFQYFIIRGTETDARVFHLDGAAGDALILQNSFEILSGDIVYITRNRPVNWNLDYDQIIQYTEVFRS